MTHPLWLCSASLFIDIHELFSGAGKGKDQEKGGTCKLDPFFVFHFKKEKSFGFWDAEHCIHYSLIRLHLVI